MRVPNRLTYVEEDTPHPTSATPHLPRFLHVTAGAYISYHTHTTCILIAKLVSAPFNKPSQLARPSSEKFHMSHAVRAAAFGGRRNTLVAEHARHRAGKVVSLLLLTPRHDEIPARQLERMARSSLAGPDVAD